MGPSPLPSSQLLLWLVLPNIFQVYHKGLCSSEDCSSYRPLAYFTDIFISRKKVNIRKICKRMITWTDFKTMKLPEWSSWGNCLDYRGSYRPSNVVLTKIWHNSQSTQSRLYIIKIFGLTRILQMSEWILQKTIIQISFLPKKMEVIISLFIEPR